MLTRSPIPSPNYSSRGGAGVRLVVIHASEGATTFAALGNFFANPSSGVSSHTGIDDTPNVIGEYVRADWKAWTAANANPVAVQAELCVPSGASAGWTAADWNRHPTMLENCGRWVAEECARFGIPVRKLSPAEAQGGAAGVCQHKDLGVWGGNHSDCGPGFPIDTVLAIAADGAAAPAPSTGESDMVLLDPVTGGYWVAWPDGSVYTLDGAPYLGGCNNRTYNPQGFPCVGIAARPDDDGYVLVLDFGTGTGKAHDPRVYNFARNGSGIVG
jgi:hypothetical protein